MPSYQPPMFICTLAAQLAGLGLRVSCNSRLWGPCLGCIGVGVASAFAGATLHTLGS